MKKTQLLMLFLCNLVPSTIGYGIAPLLPVQAAGLGASQGAAGVCLSLSQFAMAAGTLLAGWLSGRIRRLRVLAIVAGLVSTAPLYLMGWATTTGVLAAALSVWFFCTGAATGLISIAAGFGAERSQRGKVFGLLALASGMGSLLGGLLGGPIADRHGYASMYAVLALLGVFGPLAALLGSEWNSAPAQRPDVTAAAQKTTLGRSFQLLFAARLVAAVASFVFFLGRSFVMTDLGFSGAALSTAAAIGAALGLPVPLLAGWLSDRLGRQRFLALSFVATTAGILVLAFSTDLWHFWLASALFTLSFAGGPAGNALAADLLPPQSLGRGLGLCGATTWLGGIGGCVLTGYSVQGLGTTPTLLTGALLPLLAAGLLAPIGWSRHLAVRSAGHTETATPADLVPATA
jgi:MFS family permease